MVTGPHVAPVCCCSLNCGAIDTGASKSIADMIAVFCVDFLLCHLLGGMDVLKINSYRSAPQWNATSKSVIKVTCSGNVRSEIQLDC